MGIQEELDTILSEWEEDCKIDELDMQSETIRTPILHSKYLQYLRRWRTTRLSLDIKYGQLKGKKIKYWKGEMSKEELDKLGWTQWRFKAPLKSEIENYVNSDKELNNIKLQMEAVNIGIDTLEAIIKQIGQRDFEVSSYIKMRCFNRGDE